MQRIVDIRALSDAVKEINDDVLIAVDNTFMTPYFQVCNQVIGYEEVKLT